RTNAFYSCTRKGRFTMHRRQALKLLAGLALCPLCTPNVFGAEHHWAYEGEGGPDKWGGLDAADAACSGGHQQSPIDISGPSEPDRHPSGCPGASDRRRLSTMVTPSSSTSRMAPQRTSGTVAIR